MSKKDTEFKGAVSLDAIFAATSKKTETPNEVESPVKKEIEEPVKEVEEVITAPPKPTEDSIVKEASVEAPPVEQKKEVEEVKVESEAYKTALRLVKLGVLEDFSIQTSDEDETGTLISEFTSMTDDNLEEILKIQKQEKDAEVSTNYISKEGLEEHQVKVIEILKNGGDLSQIADTKEQAFERPFEGYDLENKDHLINILFTDLVYSKGLDKESAEVLIKKEIDKDTLKDSATKVFNAYRESHSKYIDDKLAEQRKKKEIKDFNFKENKKALAAKLKESGIKESVYKKVSAEYAKKNNKGEYALVDKLKEILESPEDNFEIILHLADKKVFNDLYKIKASQETQKHVIKLATGATSKGNRKSVSKQVTAEAAPWLRGINS